MGKLSTKEVVPTLAEEERVCVQRGKKTDAQYIKALEASNRVLQSENRRLINYQRKLLKQQKKWLGKSQK